MDTPKGRNPKKRKTGGGGSKAPRQYIQPAKKIIHEPYEQMYDAEYDYYLEYADLPFEQRIARIRRPGDSMHLIRRPGDSFHLMRPRSILAEPDFEEEIW